MVWGKLGGYWAEFGEAKNCLNRKLEHFADPECEVEAGGVIASFECSDGLWVDVHE